MFSAKDIQTELIRYEGGMQTLRDAVSDLSPDQCHARPVAGKWSMLECVCHLADFEPIIAYRIKSMLAFDRPELVGIDESTYGNALHYSRRSIQNEVEVFVTTRLQLLEILRAAGSDDFARRGRHTELGEISVMSYLRSASGHIEHHMRFMNDKRVAFGLAAVACAESRDYPARPG